jgi:hypothetical protein
VNTSLSFNICNYDTIYPKVSADRDSIGINEQRVLE